MSLIDSHFVCTFICNVAYGALSFVLLSLTVYALVLLYETSRKLIKNKLNGKDVRKGQLHGKNVIVTGGSSGIGKCVAIEAARQGANVTIIARDLEKLKQAKDEIIKSCNSERKIDYLSLDVSSSYEDVRRAFTLWEEQWGPCYMLVNCAGTAICGKIEDTTEDTLRYLINLNLLGSYFCTKAVVPSMKLAKEGKIVIVSSQAALLGIFGYSAYCSTKFALRGLAETLAMELTPHNVSVTLSLPPDTDTPGFAIEEQSKPLETKLISECAALVKPEIVAEKIMNDALEGKFFSIVGFESFILTTLCSGMSPYSSFSELILQLLLMGPLRIISAFYLYSFQNIILKCIREREKQKKSE